VNWTEASGANCTAYQESWDIFIVNGTASEPSTMATGQCIDMTTQTG
jgi:hypothetical protein